MSPNELRVDIPAGTFGEMAWWTINLIACRLLFVRKPYTFSDK